MFNEYLKKININLIKNSNKEIVISTSGTMGKKKSIVQPNGKIKIANKIAREVQMITQNSKVYTVCSLGHAAGLLAQTLPALEVKATVFIESFNPFVWIRNIKNFTHSHLTPKMAKAIIKTKSWKDLNLEGKIITCGSEGVPAFLINKFVEKGCTFIVNWGMTEIGPIAINETIKPSDAKVEDLKIGKKTLTLMGNKVFSETKIIQDELHVKGDICVYEEWFATGDIVKLENKRFWFHSRKNEFRCDNLRHN